jgi:hypothetical protein
MRGGTRVSGGNSRRALRRLIVFATAALVATAVIGIAPTGRAAQPPPLDGIPTGCPTIDIGITEIPDGGWTWVDPAQPLQQVTGVVNQTAELDPTGEDPTELGSFVRYSDLPTAHNSHDQNTHLVVDEADRGLLSLINDLPDDHGAVGSPGDIAPPTQLEAEWETGISPSETHGDGHSVANGGPMFPKWAWPNPGDRVWIMGNHIYDCGHPIEVAGVDRYKSEIHPAIAMASMRNQVMTLPGTGTTPVPVVATDLYIHGDGGWATSVLNTHDIFDHGTYFTTPIDRDYDFDIHLPPKPDPAAVLEWKPVSDGPFNTVGIAPVLTPELSDPADPKLQVHVPLAGSGVTPLDTYSRQIVAGWAVPQVTVRHLQIKLTRMLLHNDMETDPADGELSFFWLNVPKSPTEWQRLSDFEIPTFEDLSFPCADHTNIMDDYDDAEGCGNGILNFSGPTFDLFVMDGTPVSIEAHGYDQDCYDDGLFGLHTFGSLLGVAACFILGNGDNDPYKTLKVALNPPGYGVGQLTVSNPDNQYELRFTVNEAPVLPAPTVSITGAPAGVVLQGDTISLTADATGGTGPYTYAWTKNGAPFGTTQTITDTPGLGDTTYAVVVTDSLGAVSTTVMTVVHVYDFTVSGSPTSRQILTTGTTTYDVTETLVPGSPSSGLPTIGLSMSGLPSGATSTFTPPSGGAGGFSSTLTITTAGAPPGSYVLTLTGTDARPLIGGTRSAPLNLTILSPAQAIPSVITKIEGLEAAGVLNGGQANSLIVKLNHAIDSLNSKPNQATACNQLQAFVNEINAYVSAGILMPAQADTLLGGPLGILAIMTAIPC